MADAALGATLAMGSAVAFGVGDFVAGAASRRLSYLVVTVVSLVTSSGIAWLVVAASGDPPSYRVLGWGVAAGLGAAVGAATLYRGYGRGQMAVAGPLSAVGTAALPAMVGVALGDRLGVAAVVGVLVALPAIWLMSSTGHAGGGVRAGVPEGLLSGAGFALEFVGLARAGHASGLWPVAVSQTTALLVIVVVVLTRRPHRTRDPRAHLLAVAAGVLSLSATALYFGAVQSGLLTVAAVLTSLYPGVTVVLAAVVLHERPRRRQLVGLVAGAAAVLLIVA